jgi:hypothetical protein
MPVSSTATFTSTRGGSTASIEAVGLSSAWTRTTPVGTTWAKARKIGRSCWTLATSGLAASRRATAGLMVAAKPETECWYVSSRVKPRSRDCRAAKSSAFPARGRRATM